MRSSFPCEPLALGPSCSNTCGFAAAWEPAWVSLGYRVFIPLPPSGYLHGCGAPKGPIREVRTLSVPADATGLDPHVLRWESSTKAIPAAEVQGEVQGRAQISVLKNKNISWSRCRKDPNRPQVIGYRPSPRCVQFEQGTGVHGSRARKALTGLRPQPQTTAPTASNDSNVSVFSNSEADVLL